MIDRNVAAVLARATPTARRMRSLFTTQRWMRVPAPQAPDQLAHPTDRTFTAAILASHSGTSALHAVAAAIATSIASIGAGAGTSSDG
jgi:hypothetical protein